MIIIEIDSKSVQDAFDRLVATGRDMTPITHAIGKEMETRIQARFESKTDPDGHPWAPWKPSTVKSYPKNGNRKMLDRHGDMLGSLNYQADSNSVSVGFGQPYAKYHEFGTSKMDRRGMLTADPDAGTLGAEDEQAILEVLRKALESSMKG